MGSLFPYVEVPTKVRKDPLGHITLNTMSRNTELLDRLARVEHTPSGEHNSLMVARTGGRLSYSGGYTCVPWNGYPTLETGHNPATGTVIVTLQAGKFFAPGLLAMASPADAEVATKPHIVGLKPSDDGSVLTLFSKKLTSSLGSGNTWAAVNTTIDFAVFSAPWDDGDTRLTKVREFQRNDGLDPDAGWNTLVDNQGLVRDSLKSEHNALGEHSDVKIPRAYVLAKYNGTSFDITDSYGVTSVSRISAGVAEVTLQEALSDIRAFSSGEYSRDNGGSADTLWVTNCRATSTTVVRVYSYKYDTGGNSWNFADNDFFLVVHGEP